MPLMLYNTATRQKEVFAPSENGHARVYACGPTVYDYFHVGNARAFIVFDTLRRVLKRRGFKVTFVQNITDIDDKIIARAARENRNAQDVAVEYTQAFLDDYRAVGCLPPDIQPKATEHLPDMIRLIQRLLDSGHAYQLNGDVYFSVRSFPKYGRVSGKNIDELEKGARVEINEQKRDPLDFALWKAAKPGEPSWDTPWGPGRPGWHIECSAMSMKYLGDSFDIHGGGEDLIFPHHENENAQSESVTGKPLARVWLHNGYLKIDGEKMSKSLGNFWRTREVLKQLTFGGTQAMRLFLLSAHYRSPLDFSRDTLPAFQKQYGDLKQTMENLADELDYGEACPPLADPESGKIHARQVEISGQFNEYLDDDLNTAGAIGQIFILANFIKDAIAGRKTAPTSAFIQALAKAGEGLKDMLETLGIAVAIDPKPDEIKREIALRFEARTRREWAQADKIRDHLSQQGWTLQDTAGWTTASRTPPAHFNSSVHHADHSGGAGSSSHPRKESES